MAAITRSNRYWLAFALAVLVIVGLFVAFYSVTPGADAPAPDNASEPAAVTIETGSALSDAPVMAATRLDDPDAAGDRDAPSAATLQEAELEHLREVFRNSLYALFQYDFPMDREGRVAIDAFVASMPEDLGSGDLDTIAQMIAEQLQTPEAEDLAFIITHLYRLEREEARLMSGREPVSTMEGQLQAQQRLSELRDQWFGPELSEWLFPGGNDAPASISPAETESQPDAENTTALSEEQSELADIEAAWKQRYQSFLAEKQIIDRAGLDQAEKDRQIEALLQQHYTPGELEAARAYDEAQE